MSNEIDSFTKAYIECALWSSTDNTSDSGGDPLDANYDIDDIAPLTMASMIADCKSFQEENAAIFEACREQGVSNIETRAGHDFWLTRNGHGSGYWDGDWPAPYDKQLTDAAHAYGAVDLYVGDDGMIYGSK